MENMKKDHESNPERYTVSLTTELSFSTGG